ncbi:CENP-A-nucleosome distal centromere subunit CENP-Q [Penicillium macrosclerotiorum]|uniref:CENP-A-nucleosome distal centromere subunit CENP-Q n=1 Tax=Penicillium macrosclerotiorum TaxID=303699 RepID=UPI002549BD79|nr:CENP-A-nucleosome distal centromere subunit CENP-Q [Penicillium macrosclerotiorum]KAJ5666700.1 CENP-A-nucleosome distal centromere subunit CENP-Q [Penicillium macrosclerotiorum]
MPPKRKRSDEEQFEDDSQKRFAYLKPQVRRVPEKTIKSKWTTLPDPVQDKVRDLFQSLERPVIMRQQNERKRIEAQGAVQAVVRKFVDTFENPIVDLSKRLPRMPFPPITKDSNFDYESALDEHRTLEANLATMKDSIDLLKAEVAKEEALLANEKKSLEEMDKNAKKAEAERKRQMKNEHPVLRRLDEIPQTQGLMAEFSLVDLRVHQASLDELDDDPEIQGLIKQLHGHLQSMQANTAPLAGLKDAITRSQAALDLYSMAND